MEKIAVLIPCYNEELTIGKVVKDLKKALPEAHIYVYDNNSTDKTAEIAKKAGATVRYCYQQGKGNVIRKMFREVNAECYVMTDGDDTYPAESAPKLVQAILKYGADMAIGDRLSSTYFNENKRPFHNLGNTLVRWIINKLFHSDIKDIMTGYRAFSYAFVKSFPILSEGFEIETEMSIHAADKNLYIRNVVIDYKDRPKGSESKLNTYSDGMKVLLKIFSLFRTYKPLRFFSLIAVTLSVVAIAFLIPILIDFSKTGLVPKTPTLITCGFALLTAIIALFTGLILENFACKNRQDFEIRLINNAKENVHK